jgi:dolichyl-phosphate-mannose-protein mannosyltransferase
MIARLAASLLAALLTGLLAIGSLRRRHAAMPRARLWLGSLAAGMGLGLSSLAFFLWIAVAGAPSAGFPIAELVLLLLLAGLAFQARPARGPAPTVRDGSAPPHPALLLVVWLSLGCAAAAFLAHSATNPQGGWDAWMTWNMHARAIVRGGAHWREVLAGLPSWSHPDYPLLVPGSIARIWSYMGRETPFGPASVALLFTFATIGLLYASLSIVRSPTQGCLAALVLLSTKFFILHGTSQYADVPLAFFMLATLSLLALAQVWPDERPGLVLLAGAAAGLAAWTKNEGLLLLPALLLGYGWTIGVGGRAVLLRDARAFACGLVPILVMVAWFKLLVTSTNDLMSDQGGHQTAARLLEGGRYLQVLAGLARGALDVTGQGLLALLLLVYWFCAGPAPAGPWRVGARAAALALTLMLLGYVVVLLTAPDPLLATNVRSLNRLLLQLWPSAIFAYFLSLRTAEEAALSGWPSRVAEPAPTVASPSPHPSEAP